MGVSVVLMCSVLPQKVTADGIIGVSPWLKQEYKACFELGSIGFSRCLVDCPLCFQVWPSSLYANASWSADDLSGCLMMWGEPEVIVCTAALVCTLLALR